MQDGATNAEQWLPPTICASTPLRPKKWCLLWLAVPPLTIGGNTIEQVAAFKLLGVTVTSNLSWSPHIKTVLKKKKKKKKVNQRLFLLSRMKHAGLGTGAAGALLHSSDPYLNMPALHFWFSSLAAYLLKDVKSAQRRALRTAFGPQLYDALLRVSGLPTPHERLRTLNYNFYTGMKSPNHRFHLIAPF